MAYPGRFGAGDVDFNHHLVLRLSRMQVNHEAFEARTTLNPNGEPRTQTAAKSSSTDDRSPSPPPPRVRFSEILLSQQT